MSAESAVDVASMASIQSDVHSSAGFRWAPHILAAIEKAQGLSMGEETPENESDERLLAFSVNTKIGLKTYMCDFQNG